MVKRVYCGKKTKVYIPKTVNPKIITYKTADNNGIAGQNSFSCLNTDSSISEVDSEKRR